MITRETVVKTNGFVVRFTVYDETEWLVSISSDELEKGATGMPCNGNWDKGLATAVDNISSILTFDELDDLFHGLKHNENIDNNFMNYLENQYNPCLGCIYMYECERSWDLCDE